jgi:hypothetical protein
MGRLSQGPRRLNLKYNDIPFGSLRWLEDTPALGPNGGVHSNHLHVDIQLGLTQQHLTVTQSLAHLPVGFLKEFSESRIGRFLGPAFIPSTA